MHCSYELWTENSTLFKREMCVLSTVHIGYKVSKNWNIYVLNFKFNSVNVKLMIIGKHLLIAPKHASFTGCSWYNIIYTNIMHYMNYKYKYV